MANAVRKQIPNNFPPGSPGHVYLERRYPSGGRNAAQISHDDKLQNIRLVRMFRQLEKRGQLKPEAHDALLDFLCEDEPETIEASEHK